ncbi:hypothetical protein I3843_15G117200 [Carya illinoinensis]|nr:hypothetical protein I3843_15G117200 [Carya illinoinensis]
MHCNVIGKHRGLWKLKDLVVGWWNYGLLGLLETIGCPLLALQAVGNGLYHCQRVQDLWMDFEPMIFLCCKDCLHIMSKVVLDESRVLSNHYIVNINSTYSNICLSLIHVLIKLWFGVL